MNINTVNAFSRFVMRVCVTMPIIRAEENFCAESRTLTLYVLMIPEPNGYFLSLNRISGYFL